MGQIFPGGDEGMVKDGVKEQASGTLRLYTLLNFAGSGCFVDYMKEARKTRDYDLLDRRLQEALEPYLYNGGEGLWFHIRDLVRLRARLTTPAEVKGLYTEDIPRDASGGELVGLMKQANRTKNYLELDRRIQEWLKPFLYNEGEGRWVHIRELIAARCRDRGVEPPRMPNNNEISLKTLEAVSDKGSNFFNKHGSQYKKLCWKLDEMGAVGETALHVCLLNATSIHADLSKRLLRNFPALINDIYISDEYFGENVLHMAIVNEDPAMVKFLLDNGCDYHQRAIGNFFTADDQKSRRKDNFDHEWYDLPTETNYIGYTYWGEYPLGFAACLGQEECVRLLVAKGADPNLTDSNGCTVLHMLVVHDNKLSLSNTVKLGVKSRMKMQLEQRRQAMLKLHLSHQQVYCALRQMATVYCPPKEMFDLLVNLGAKLDIMNNQSLTPLTLAAKLGRKEIYEHILELQREVFWIYGNVTCAAYPLEHIDTISETGEIDTNSAMYHIIYGDKPEHLDMIDGVIDKLLEEKWKTFARYRFSRRFLVFVVYFMIFMLAIALRPGTDTRPVIYQTNRTSDNGTVYVQNVTQKNPCYLLRFDSREDVVRWVFESLTVLGSTLYLYLSMKEIYHQGYHIFFQTLIAAPAKTLFLVSNIFVIMTVPGRAACAYVYEDVIVVFAILCCAPYYLFFCRGFKIVGPFVVMIYKMIRTDLLRFFIIYLIFVIGFSQGMYLCFIGMDATIFNNPLEACMGMFIMSLGEFSDIYDSFHRTKFDWLTKGIFFVYMILVTLLLINMLIAMMGNTYQAVNEMQGEYLRQWGKIILVVEQTISTDRRRIEQINYSQPLDDNRRALIIRWRQSEKEQARLKERRQEMKAKERTMLQRKADARMYVISGGHVNVEQARMNNMIPTSV